MHSQILLMLLVQGLQWERLDQRSLENREHHPQSCKRQREVGKGAHDRTVTAFEAHYIIKADKAAHAFLKGGAAEESCCTGQIVNETLRMCTSRMTCDRASLGERSHGTRVSCGCWMPILDPYG